MQFGSVTESAVVFLNKSALRYDFRADPRTVRHSGDIALLGETNKNDVVCESNISTKKS